jgi:hypothetical protein
MSSFWRHAFALLCAVGVIGVKSQHLTFHFFEFAIIRELSASCASLRGRSVQVVLTGWQDP